MSFFLYFCDQYSKLTIMDYQIFISYRREGGAALAYLLNQGLTNLGHSVFYDIESLSSGKFDEKLLAVIEHCPNFIVLLTPHVFDRCIDVNDWIRRESIQAMKCGKNIIPVMDRYFEWPDTMVKELEPLKSYNGVEINYLFFDGVIDKIEKLLNNQQEVTKSADEISSPIKHVLVWSDFESKILEKIIGKLKLDDSYYVEILTEPIEILTKNLSRISSIILIDTDVTKLSNNNKALERINEELVNYVGNGGKLIATHDIIYRRARNFKLQEMYGYKTTHFIKQNAINYRKTALCDELSLFKDIKEDLILHDDELCWGEKLAPDTNVFFTSDDGHPLVFSREYGKGQCIWLNPGDFKEYPPASILKPENGFISILRELILM